MTVITLYAESGWISPWVFHAMVALEEKQLPYRLEVLHLPLAPEQKDELRRRAVLGKVPVLAHGDVWISESLAISEYLAETFPFPAHPRLFPADLVERARARQVMSFLRTDLMPLREERPTTSIFGEPITAPLSPSARASADELIQAASALIAPGRTTLFADWCIADADLALALMRLRHDDLPPALVAYVDAQWARPSVQRYVQQPR